MVAIRATEAAAPCAVGGQGLPVLAKLLVRRRVGLVDAADEQVEVDRQPLDVQAVDNALAGLGVEFGLLWRAPSLAKGQFHAVVVGIFDEQPDQAHEASLLLAQRLTIAGHAGQSIAKTAASLVAALIESLSARAVKCACWTRAKTAAPKAPAGPG